jgi:hypothetical protein
MSVSCLPLRLPIARGRQIALRDASEFPSLTLASVAFEERKGKNDERMSVSCLRRR